MFIVILIVIRQMADSQFQIIKKLQQNLYFLQQIKLIIKNMNLSLKISMLIYVLLLLCSVSCSTSYQTISKQFSSMKVKSLASLVPSIIINAETKPQKVMVSMKKFLNLTEADFQGEITDYEKNYQKYLQSLKEDNRETQKWTSDPQMSSVFDLSQQRRNQSFLIKGYQTSLMVIDINVRDKDVLKQKNDGIMLFIINLSALNDAISKLQPSQRQQHLPNIIKSSIQYKAHIYRHHFSVIPVNSDIYEIFIAQQPQTNPEYSNLHISLQLSIEKESFMRLVSSYSLSPQQQNEMVRNMRQIVQANDLTFLDSLELWQKIEQHRQQHEKSFQWNESVEWYECMGLAVIYIVEYAVLRFISRKKSVV